MNFGEQACLEELGAKAKDILSILPTLFTTVLDARKRRRDASVLVFQWDNVLVGDGQ